MASLPSLFLCFFISLFLPLSAAQQGGGWLDDPCIYYSGNITTNSTYHQNLNQLLSSFTSFAQNNYGFYNVSVGRNPDEVNAIALCRGDVKPDVCLSCVIDVATELRNRCLTKKASQYYDDCMVRYSEVSDNSLAGFPTYYCWGEGDNATNVSAFNNVLMTLLDRMRITAAGGGSLRKYAEDSAIAPPSEAIYALVQCTPDLTQRQCSSCLSQTYDAIPTCCQNKRGGRIFGPSCIVWFSDTLFYSTSAPNGPSLSPPLSPSTSSPSPAKDVPKPSASSSPPAKDNRTRRMIIVAVASILSILLFVLCFWTGLRLLKRRVKDETIDEMIKAGCLQYDFFTIQAATNNFCDESKLGQGGFGAVYKGQLPNGQVVAVKRLFSDSRQGDSEFKNEVFLVAKLQHRNLVKLLGFCLEGNERLLIFEFMPNGGLDHFLFDPVRHAQLNWETRYKIIGGIARGLLYLHEDSRLKVIHRDMKVSNILLDEDMNPKIADFGLARLFVVDETHDSTSRLAGTYGYMAPEYVMHRRFSVKTDVFSFGVIILEIVSGQKNNAVGNHEEVVNIISIVWRNWIEGTPLNVVDPNMREGSTSQIIRCIHIGLLCVQENLLQRPTMSLVVAMLTGCPMTLPVPSHPAFLIIHSAPQSRNLNSGTLESHQSNNGMALASTNQVTISELHPR